MRKTLRELLATTWIATLVVAPSFAAIEPLRPSTERPVQLLSDLQKRVMAVPTLADRIRLLESDAKNERSLRHDKLWRESLPFFLEIKTTAGERGPWKVLIGKCPDLSDARVWYLPAEKTSKGKSASKETRIVRLDIPFANLEIAAKYYWKVIWRGRCGSGCSPNHGCEACRRVEETPISCFITEDVAPRWIGLEGRVDNVRDFGGRLGRDGRRVRQGMIFRGEGLNDNSISGEAPGRNRLTTEDVRYLTETLGVKTDLDLRAGHETGGMTVSPLGASVAYIRNSSGCYRQIFTETYDKRTMAKNFRVFCDRGNYPIYFHCIGGADRTGSLAYVLNGVLGVSRQENETDWESTFYPYIPDSNPNQGVWRRESHFNEGFVRYGGAETPWNERIVLYLKECGITDKEIAAFREIMLLK